MSNAILITVLIAASALHASATAMGAVKLDNYTLDQALAFLGMNRAK